MKIDVWDTYATSKTGALIHFDVLLKSGEAKELALKHGRAFLESIGESGDQLRAERCNYCHSENAPAEIISAIESSGCYILQMEGCPNAR